MTEKTKIEKLNQDLHDWMEDKSAGQVKSHHILVTHYATIRALIGNTLKSGVDVNDIDVVEMPPNAAPCTPPIDREKLIAAREWIVGRIKSAVSYGFQDELPKYETIRDLLDREIGGV